MQMKRLGLAAIVVGISGLLSTGLSAQQQGGSEAPIGKVSRVSGLVSLEHKAPIPAQPGVSTADPTRAKADDLIYQNDVISTGADGAAGIVFIDGTSFDISANARMELNEFVYKPKSKANSTIINLTKGTFTFIAGEVAHTGSMKVETPVATMGIRGTAPRVQILDDGSVKFTTLVEENKKRPDAAGRPGGAVTQRSVQSPPLLDPVLLDKAEKDWNSRPKLCGNC